MSDLSHVENKGESVQNSGFGGDPPILLLISLLPTHTARQARKTESGKTQKKNSAAVAHKDRSKCVSFLNNLLENR